MKLQTKNLLVRTVAGAVYVSLMVAGVFIFPLMDVLMLLVACLSVFEFSKMASGPVDRPMEGLLVAGAVVLFGMILFYGMEPDSFLMNASTLTMVLFYLSIPVLLMVLLPVVAIFELFRRRPMPVEQIGRVVMGLLWIIVPLGSLTVFSQFCPVLALAFLLMIWAYDTFAYLGGSLYGRNKMCEHISPKKTWEGTMTGVVMTIVLAMVLPSIPFFGSMGIAIWKWVVYALIIVVFGTFGDLLESLFKRHAGLKDSGRVIPGHGGVLDRFDSILFAAVPAFLFAVFVMILR